MTLYELSVKIQDLRAEYGDEVEIKSFRNKQLSPDIFYDEDDDCIYVEAL